MTYNKNELFYFKHWLGVQYPLGPSKKQAKRLLSWINREQSIPPEYNDHWWILTNVSKDILSCMKLPVGRERDFSRCNK